MHQFHASVLAAAVMLTAAQSMAADALISERRNSIAPTA